MDVKKAIDNRASVRNFIDKEVSDEVLLELIDAARKAPSGSNAQSWKFKILRDYPKIFKQDFVYDAPSMIVFCADTSKYKSASNLSDGTMRAIRDLGICSAFSVLRAEELGLGTCYIGWMDKDALREHLGLTEEYIVPFVLMVGYPSQKNQTKKKSIKEVLIP